MSATKNLIENLRGIELCMADIKRTMNLNDVESPLAMHGTPRHNVKSVTDARAIAAELDMSAVAGALDDGQIESISEQIQVDYEELADKVDCSKVAALVDLPETKLFVHEMMSDQQFMDALAARLVVALMRDQLYIGVVTASATAGANAQRAAAAPVPAVRSDADPLTGIEYGTPT